MSDFDSPWKETLDMFLEPFLRLFFPAAHAGIEWAAGYEPLDKELQQILRDAELGPRLADKLFKVRRNDGQEAWVLIHIEVQNQVEENFSERMYTYNYRIFDRYRRPVVSLAVLGDDRDGWRPTQYDRELWGVCRPVSVSYRQAAGLRGEGRTVVVGTESVGGSPGGPPQVPRDAP